MTHTNEEIERLLVDAVVACVRAVPPGGVLVNDRVREHLLPLMERIRDEAWAACQAAAVERERPLVEALEKYAKHARGCAHQPPDPGSGYRGEPCDCPARVALLALATVRGQKEK